MITDSERLWDQFREAFDSALREVNPERFSKDWHVASQRTQLFKECVSRVSEQLNLKFVTEFLSIDFVLADKDSGVPVIAIESENDPFTVSNEISKLCSVAAPLRILLTVAYWDPQIGGWPDRPNGEQLFLEKWETDIRKRLSTWRHPGLFGLIVGERGQKGQTTFYSYLFDLDGANGFRERAVQAIPAGSQ